LRFTARDPDSMAEMVERVFDDHDLRERMIADAAEHVLRFDWADVAERTAEIYAELAGVGRT
jgi:glycogen(starch) synthase